MYFSGLTLWQIHLLEHIYNCNKLEEQTFVLKPSYVHLRVTLASFAVSKCRTEMELGSTQSNLWHYWHSHENKQADNLTHENDSAISKNHVKCFYKKYSPSWLNTESV